MVRGFDPPDVVWGAGHRGVDLLGSAGQAVHAALPGTVTFAGMLAGRGVVVVDHGDTRTTYEPVTASVDVGALVAQGAVIGTARLGRLALSALRLPALGLAAGRDLPRPARPGRGRAGAAAAPVARRSRRARSSGQRAAASWPLAWPSPYAAILLRLAELARPPPGALAGPQARGCACW